MDHRRTPTDQDTTYTYDDRDRLVVLTAPGGRVTHYEYDDATHRIRVIAPDGRTTDLVDVPGHHIVAAPDPATGRVVDSSVPVPARPCVTYSYAAGKLLAVTDRGDRA